MKSVLFAIAATLALPMTAIADPAYFIAQIQVDNWDKFMSDYGPKAFSTLMEHDGKVLVGGPGAMPLEGDWSGNHTVVIEFENREAINKWYNSAEYQEALPLRLQNTSTNNIVIVDGFKMPK